MKDYYAILGVPRNASVGEIREAFRDRVKKCHPDSSQTSDTVGSFIDAQEAYDVLRDEGRRHDYDIRLDGPPDRSRSAANRGFGSPIRETRRPYAAARGRPAELDLILDPQEARRGGRVELSTADGGPCPVCGGTGRLFVFPCVTCRGRGIVGRAMVVAVDIPPGVRSGDRLVGYDRGVWAGVPVADIRVVVEGGAW